MHAVTGPQRQQVRAWEASARSVSSPSVEAPPLATHPAQFLALAGTLLAGYSLVVRPWHRRWGATDAETRRAMPGDDLVPDPTYVTNRAITIHARPARIWPWLVQMGEAPRAGFYSYAAVERALGMHAANTDRLLPGYEHLQVGDALDRAGALVVKEIRYEEALVLGPPEGSSWGDISWSIGLYPVDDERTRVVSRVRARIDRWRPQTLAWALLLDPGHFVMERKWLLGLKERVENSIPDGGRSAAAPPLPFPQAHARR